MPIEPVAARRRAADAGSIAIREVSFGFGAGRPEVLDDVTWRIAVRGRRKARVLAAPQLLDALQACLTGHFDVEHSTFQLEAAAHAGHETGTH